VNYRGFLLDTMSSVSELVRPVPEARVAEWLRQQRAADLFLASVTLGDIVRGVVRLADDPRRRGLESWVTELLPRQFAGRILAFDQETAVLWGELMGAADRVGRTRAAADAQIAATAVRHSLVLVTRNVSDFEGLIAALLDPWQ
jgi:predicted nucleic acid-binding protein